MRTRQRVMAWFSAALLCVGPARAWAAETPYVPKQLAEQTKVKKKAKAKAKKREGWIPKLEASFSFALNQSQGVVGVPDGVTVAVGLQLHGSVTYRRGGHEWTSRLDVLQTQSKVPSLEPFIKSADRLDLESVYLYHFPRPKWLGVYAGLGLTTPLFPGNLVQASDTALDLNGDGTADASALANKPYEITKPFAPFMFKQFAGLAAKPLSKSWLGLEVRLGTGATEVWTRGGYVVDDDDSTKDLLELSPMQDYVQGGVELIVSAEGKLAGKLFSYGLKLDVVLPFATNADTDKSLPELTTMDLGVNMAIHVAKWAALTYSLSVLRYPLIVDGWQIASNLMLSLTASVGE